MFVSFRLHVPPIWPSHLSSWLQLRNPGLG